MKTKNRRYLVWGYYGFGNLGDELMLGVITRRIRAADPGARIYVRCRQNPGIAGIIPFCIEERKGILYKIAVYPLRIFAMIIRIDIFVIGGGTLFLDKGRHNISMLVLAAAVLCSRVLSKRICVMGSGIDDLRFPANRFYLKTILNNSFFIALRDDFSVGEAKKLVSGRLVTRSSDILYDQEFVRIAQRHKTSGGKGILIALSDYFKSFGSESERRLFFKHSCGLIRDLLRRCYDGNSIVLCAFQKNEGECDYEFLDDVRNSLIRDNDIPPEKITLVHVKDIVGAAKLYGVSAVTISNRYHALVLSSIFGVPFLGIDVETKIRTVCDEFRMPHIAQKIFLDGGVPESIMTELARLTVSKDLFDDHLSRSGENFKWQDEL